MILLLFCSYVFWMGDLNFRLDDLPKAEIEKRVIDGDYEYLQKHDQVYLISSLFSHT